MTIRAELGQYAENETGEQFTRQNAKMLKIELAAGGVHALRGSMVAYQGEVKFENKGSGGLGKMMKKATTGEGVDLMYANGTGELFLADQANDIHILYLENDKISVNGKSVLAFSESISHDIQRIGSGMAGALAGGLYNTTLTGTGFVAVMTEGTPVMLDVASAPTFGDAQAVVMWSGGVTMQLKTDTTGGLKSMVRGGSGEAIQMAFGGQGFVLVQPSEGPKYVGGGDGGGGLLGALGG
jgi:uncharacterized protein (AIM24 family)